MSPESRRTAGILLLALPTVMFGGVTLLRMLIGSPEYMANPLRQDLWRAGHAHAGVILLFSLIALHYVDQASLSDAAKRFVRLALPAAAIFLPLAFFTSVLRPDATEPNVLINLAYIGGGLLAAGTVTLGVGLLSSRRV
jgi:hypothetical protein